MWNLSFFSVFVIVFLFESTETYQSSVHIVNNPLVNEQLKIPSFTRFQRHVADQAIKRRDTNLHFMDDDGLHLFCHPPNPCPLGFENDDCDSSPFDMFTPEFSRHYQKSQNCPCSQDDGLCIVEIQYIFVDD